MHPEEGGGEQYPPPQEHKGVNLVQEGKDEVILEIITRSKKTMTSEPIGHKVTKKTYKRPHFVPSKEPALDNAGGDTGISEKAKRYKKRCRNSGVPRYLSNAPIPEVKGSNPDTAVKLLNVEKEGNSLEDYHLGSIGENPQKREKGPHKGPKLLSDIETSDSD